MVRLLPFGAYPSGAYMENPGEEESLPAIGEGTLQPGRGIIMFAPRSNQVIATGLNEAVVQAAEGVIEPELENAPQEEGNLSWFLWFQSME
jgi:hypothetical protein